MGSLKTWRRVEFALDRVDELALVGSGVVAEPLAKMIKEAV